MSKRTDVATPVAAAAASARSIGDDELLASFESGRVPEGGFHHEEHVRVAWLHLRREAWPLALARFSEGLKRFARAQGQPGLYHETVTVAFFLVIQERMADAGAGGSFDEFARRHPDLLAWKPSVLDRYYEKATLDSDRARRTFVMPDRLAVPRC
jgi:hypothetical protein